MQARRQLHDQGITKPLLNGIAEIIKPSSMDTILDAGCGEGFYLGRLAEETKCRGCGVDISLPAVEAAARRYPECQWVVANADRLVPYPAASFSIVLTITARMNAPEFRRVLQDSGRLLVAVPAPDDFIELRGSGRDRVAATVAAFTPIFKLVSQHRITTKASLNDAGVRNVLLSIYRPMQAKPAEAMAVTFSLDLLLFEPNG